MLAIVFGTYNRLSMLQQAVASIRWAAPGVDFKIIVVDGGSTDGSREWLAQQPDVIRVDQEGPLPGAVIAFNAGFTRAFDEGATHIGHFNDDAQCMGRHDANGRCVDPDMWGAALREMDADDKVGAVAFAFDVWGPYRFDYCAEGKVYTNFGVIRADVARRVALAQGDRRGKKLWNPIYHTYGADSEVGCWIWKLGYTVVARADLRVHDLCAQDGLRKNNYTHHDPTTYRERWGQGLHNGPDPMYTEIP